MSDSIGKALFAAVAMIGIGMVAIVLFASQLSASRAADRIVTLTEPTVNEAGVQRLRADLEQATAAAEAVREAGLPFLAEATAQTKSGLLEALETNAPEFSDGLARYAETQALADMIITNLEQRRGQFESAASLPGLGLTLRDAVLAELALGFVLIGVGLAGVIRARVALAAVVLGVGAALVVTPLALNHPSKTADTDAVIDSLRPFSVDKVEARAAALASAYALFDGFQEEVVPYAVSEAGLTATELGAGLEDASPALSPAGFSQVAVVLDRFGALVEFSSRIQPLLVTADELSARTTMWLLIGPGIALILAGAGGLAITLRVGRTDEREGR